ncbi:MAG: hypothetical protein ABI680_08190 [Chthoniobacteraceae bacterium]
MNSGLQAAGFDQFKNRVKIDVSRQKSVRTKGGDFDDKREEIRMRVQMKNQSTNAEFKGYQGLIIAISESLAERNQYKLVIKQEFPIALAAGATAEFVSDERVEGWDNTGVIWGFKYDGYCLLIFDPEGKLVVTKTSTSKCEKLAKNYEEVKEGDLLDKDMKSIGRAPVSRVK